MAKKLEPNSVSAKIAHTVADWKKYPTQFYNLDAIISVGANTKQRRNSSNQYNLPPRATVPCKSPLYCLSLSNKN